MKTRCSRCRKLIDYGNSYCDKCKSKMIKQYKERSANKYVESTTKSSRWKTLRKDIVTRDKGCCVLCFKNGIMTYKRLEVHHIVKRIDDESLIYEPSNLVTVCKTCHEILEKMTPAKQKEILGNFYEEEIHYLL